MHGLTAATDSVTDHAHHHHHLLVAGVACCRIALNILNGRFSGRPRNLDNPVRHAGLLPVSWWLPLPVAILGRVGQLVAWSVALINYVIHITGITGHLDEEKYILFAV